MTEKEKAANRLLYDANNDEELLKEREKANRRLFEYNHLSPDMGRRKQEIIQALFGGIKEGFVIEAPFYCDYGYNISAGRNFYANVGCVILDGAKVIIGDNVFMAPYAGIYTAGHPLNKIERRNGLEYAYPVIIGDDVWIGTGAMILPGVTIGSGAVIGAGSVVTKDIPANTVAAGNPCKVIKEIK